MLSIEISKDKYGEGQESTHAHTKLCLELALKKTTLYKCKLLLLSVICSIHLSVSSIGLFRGGSN